MCFVRALWRYLIRVAVLAAVASPLAGQGRARPLCSPLSITICDNNICGRPGAGSPRQTLGVGCPALWPLALRTDSCSVAVKPYAHTLHTTSWPYAAALLFLLNSRPVGASSRLRRLMCFERAFTGIPSREMDGAESGASQVVRGGKMQRHASDCGLGNARTAAHLVAYRLVTPLRLAPAPQQAL
jgi:hypothetical protein